MDIESKSWTNRSPGDLSIALPEVHATPVEPVIAAAAAAAASWAATPVPERAEMLRAARDLVAGEKDALARGIAIETGKPITEAIGELGAVIAKFDLTIEDAQDALASMPVESGPHPATIRRIARGPAAVVGPFNFPLHLANGALLAHLIAGNPVIFKPSPLAAVVAGRYAELMRECFPEGVFDLVQGGAAEGEAVCLDARVRAVCFTGSVNVGRSLAVALAPDFSKELALELGGKNATIICADADLDLAAALTAEGACLTCGQRCNATSRVIVERSVAADFRGRLITALEKFQPGDPTLPATRLGPLISNAAVERYRALLAAPVEWLLPGRVEQTVAGKQGYFVRPAVAISRDPIPPEEAFVPLLTFTEVDDLDEAIRVHNATPYGLTASIFSGSEPLFRRLADLVRAGNIYANLATTFSPSTLPFGGIGESGNGRPGGRGFIRFTTQEQAVQWTGFETTR